ncbi:MAG: RidA family protein [Deltaproteobacteria bacterium]|nr:RidA family protein [Deltaproteobacteria bacterium]
MERKVIQPVDMRDTRSRYSLGWRVGNTIYTAGQLANDEEGNLVAPNDIRAQTRHVWQKLSRILAVEGAKLSDVVKTTVYMTDLRYRDGYEEVHKEFFKSNSPSSTLVQVVGLALPGALIEIEAIAVVEN